MYRDSGGVLLVLLSYLATLVVEATELSVAECRDLGFDKHTLQCSSCDILTEVNLSVLKPNCTSCCIQDNVNAEATKYPKARLEVCGWRLGAYPQVQAFVKSDRPKAFPNLSIKYVRGADPIIKLMSEDGEVMETLAIDKWNTDSVEEFLQMYLIQQGQEDDFKDFEGHNEL